MIKDTIVEGVQNAPHRSLYHALGLTQEELSRRADQSPHAEGPNTVLHNGGGPRFGAAILAVLLIGDIHGEHFLSCG